MQDDKRKAPERHLWGFSIPNFGNGRAWSHRLVTDYLSPSNHLQMQWHVTPAMTAIKNVTNTSMQFTPSCTSLGAVILKLYHNAVYNSTVFIKRVLGISLIFLGSCHDIGSACCSSYTDIGRIIRQF